MYHFGGQGKSQSIVRQSVFEPKFVIEQLKKNAITRAEFAEELGIPVSTLSAYLAPVTSPKFRNPPPAIIDDIISRLKERTRTKSSNSPEFDSFLAGLKLDDDSKRNLIQFGSDFFERLQHVQSIRQQENVVALLLGYVQGGKTTYFLGLTALAIDKGFSTIIMLTGTKLNIDNQAVKRLNKHMFEGREKRDLIHIDWDNQRSTKEKLKKVVDFQSDPKINQDSKQAIIISILKNHKKIESLANQLECLSFPHNAKTMIIDDEGDQAGLNNNAKKGGTSSTTNLHIIKLRQTLKNHIYVQVTATPQAQLMLDLLDNLSPDFVSILKTGPSYIGGYELFVSDNRDKYLRSIPEQDLATYGSGNKKENELLFLEKDTPIQSLKVAILQFYLLVANCQCNGNVKGNRSMMIHPCRKQAMHEKFIHWVSMIQLEVLDILNTENTKLIESYFHDAYVDLKSTLPNMASMPNLIGSNYIYSAVKGTHITECNTRGASKSPSIDWEGTFSHILVGGASLERGFTVEGLVISYISRDSRLTTLDTMSQWQRFNGYKKDISGEIRIYLPVDMQEVFFDYAIGESALYKELELNTEMGKDLKYTHRSLRTIVGKKHTRSNIITKGRERQVKQVKNAKYVPTFPLNIDPVIERNLMNAIRSTNFAPYSDDRMHGVAYMKAFLFYEKICSLPFYKDESKYKELNLRILNFIQELSSNNSTLNLEYMYDGLDYEIEIIYVNYFSDKKYTRTLDEDGYTKSYMTGSWKGTKASQYDLGDQNRLRVLIHKFDFINKNKELVAEDKLAISVFFPDGFPVYTYFDSVTDFK